MSYIRYIVECADMPALEDKAEAELLARKIDDACAGGAPHEVTTWVRVDEAVRTVNRVKLQPRWDDEALEALDQAAKRLDALGVG